MTRGLEMQYSDKSKVMQRAEANPEDEARYLYCVADAKERVSLGGIGINGNEVYTITYNDICAVVHSCPAQPYESNDQEAVKAWVITHQKVIDTAWERWSTVLPLSFDIIIRGEGESSTESSVQDWLKREYEELKRKIEKVRGKAEYGVQVFWDPKFIAQNLTQTSSEIGKLDKEIKAKTEKILFAPSKAEAETALKELERYAREHQSYDKLQKVIGVLRRNFDLLLTHFDNPEMSPYNNVLEGFNYLVKRRTRLMKGFKKPVNIGRWLKLILLDWRFHPLIESEFKERKGKSPVQLAGCQMKPYQNWIKYVRQNYSKKPY